ncbi:hypothetical protein BKA56DRAFT_660870 [Ilyonectria sp. MPI-CAGE-AT-0026]|nr:hypothetical protein BKA56DRAFT_660870 [Ilyonectria sp. MPI-CAGE-AT-0026]
MCSPLDQAWGQGTYPWKSAEVILTIMVGGVTLIDFALYEIYMTPCQPLMPTKLLNIQNFVAVLIVGCVGQMGFYCLNVLWPMAIAVLSTTGNGIIGLMSSTTGAGLALVGDCEYLPRSLSALMSLVDEGKQGLGPDRQSTNGNKLTILGGLGVGWVEAVAILITGFVVPPEDIGVAQGLLASMRAVTGTIACKWPFQEDEDHLY